MTDDTPAAEASASSGTDTLICRVTRWYYKRRLLMFAMFAGFGLYFLYDGNIGYPKELGIAKRKEWFVNEFAKSHDEAKKAGTLDAWTADAQKQGLPTGTDGEPPKWVTYAAANGWPEDPHMYTEREIAEQFYFGYGCLGAAALVLIVLLLRKNTVLRGESDHFVTPNGAKVMFADVFKIDKRPWDTKGLAYAWYKPGGTGSEKKATIDDLMYGGADLVLDRLLSRFNGELIEKVIEQDEQQEEPEPAAGSSPESQLQTPEK
ncbi:MAG: hypothetical protein IPK32_01180 [Verrucomicrobiaceae bacterium]|nr:hypothetical protein [Verrucomicrobiaceae bacterium]